MGDLYLHLGFARRVRYAGGLHPVAVEALVRAPGAVILGATLPHLPEVEHKGASFFRRLFMPGKKKRAFWTKALEPAGSPSLELALAVMTRGKSSQPGSMARFALGLGVLSHQVLHARVSEVTADLEGSQREATCRALARVWWQQALPSLDVLGSELKPTLQLDVNANKNLVEHLNAALREAHGEAPGTDTLWRWTRGLCADVDPLVARGVLPASSGVSDDDARAKHGEALTTAVEEARRWFVFLVNRLAPLFLAGDPSREEMRAALVDDGDALRRPEGEEEEPRADRFTDAVMELRREHLRRGRNSKSAFGEISGAQQQAPAGMPPLPVDTSGPIRAPAHTQEVSVADIESELHSQPGFSAPAHTQEVSVAQIEEQLTGAAAPPPAPASTQQVSLDDIQEELAAQKQQPGAGPPPAAPTSTQQVSLDDIQEELASHQAPPTAPAAQRAVPTSTQQVSLDQIEQELHGASGPAPGDPSAPFLAGSVPVPPPPSASPAATPRPPASMTAPTSAASSAPPVAGAQTLTSDATPPAAGVAAAGTAAAGDAAAGDAAAGTAAAGDAAAGDAAAGTAAAGDAAVGDAAAGDADHAANGVAPPAPAAAPPTTAASAERPLETADAGARGGSDPSGA